MSDLEMVESSPKQMDESEIEPSTKRPKPCSSEDSASTPMKITALNDYCLEYIFGYLNATELNNVASANPRFLHAAREVFKQNYSNKWIHLADSAFNLSIRNKINESNEIDEFFGDESTVIDEPPERVMTTARKFLGNFGKVILKLHLDYQTRDDGFEDNHFWRDAEGIISKHCSNTLTQIRLQNCHGNVMEGIRIPFNRVQVLVIDDGFDVPTNVDLETNFPNICLLFVGGNGIWNTDAIQSPFHSLEEIHFTTLKLGDMSFDGVIREFVMMNPQVIRAYDLDDWV